MPVLANATCEGGETLVDAVELTEAIVYDASRVSPMRALDGLRNIGGTLRMVAKADDITLVLDIGHGVVVGAGHVTVGGLEHITPFTNGRDLRQALAKITAGEVRLEPRRLLQLGNLMCSIDSIVEGHTDRTGRVKPERQNTTLVSEPPASMPPARFDPRSAAIAESGIRQSDPKGSNPFAEPIDTAHGRFVESLNRESTDQLMSRLPRPTSLNPVAVDRESRWIARAPALGAVALGLVAFISVAAVAIVRHDTPEPTIVVSQQAKENLASQIEPVEVEKAPELTPAMKRERRAVELAAQARDELTAGRPRSALNFAERSLALQPREPQYHVLVGDARRALGHRRAAVKAYRRALRHDREYRPARRRLRQLR